MERKENGHEISQPLLLPISKAAAPSVNGWTKKAERHLTYVYALLSQNTLLYSTIFLGKMSRNSMGTPPLFYMPNIHCVGFWTYFAITIAVWILPWNFEKKIIRCIRCIIVGRRVNEMRLRCPSGILCLLYWWYWWPGSECTTLQPWALPLGWLSMYQTQVINTKMGTSNLLHSTPSPWRLQGAIHVLL